MVEATIEIRGLVKATIEIRGLLKVAIEIRGLVKAPNEIRGLVNVTIEIRGLVKATVKLRVPCLERELCLEVVWCLPGASHATTAFPRPSFRASWKMDQAVASR